MLLFGFILIPYVKHFKQHLMYEKCYIKTTMMMIIIYDYLLLIKIIIIINIYYRAI